MSDPFPTAASHRSFDHDRLRAALRLVLESERADRCAERIERASDPIVALSQLAGELTRDRVFARISRRSGKPVMPIDLSTRGAVALLAHVALDVDGERLEDGFGIDERELGDELLGARTRFGALPDLACRDTAWLIGRYRDGGLPADDRLRLLSHLQGCERCRLSLASVQDADTTLLAAVERELAGLPERTVTVGHVRHTRRLGSVAIAGGVVVLLVVMLAVASFAQSLFSSVDEPAPLFAGQHRAPDPLNGWLIQVSPVGFLEAVDLATGFKRGLDSGDSSGGFDPLYRVSATHIAAWRPSDGQRDDALTIGPIGEQFDYRLTWNRQSSYWYPSGWLDSDTLLIVKSPDYVLGQTEQEYIQRLARESQLIAFDAVTGDEAVLMTGNISAAFPSPDGKWLAVYQPNDRHWPGQTVELRPTDGRTVGEPVVSIEHRVVGDGIWLGDSSAFVATVVADQSVRYAESRQLRTLSDHGVAQVALERIAIDGERSVLASVATPDSIVPLSSSPDGRSIVYQLRSGDDGSALELVPDYDWQCFRLAVSGGEPELLTAGTTPERIFRPGWSPDGRSLALPVARAFPLASTGRLEPSVNPNATTLLVFGPNWQPGIDPMAFYSSGRDVFGWLSPDAFDSHPGETAAGGRSLAAVAPDGAAFDQLAISGGASDEHGSYVLVEDRQTQSAFAWSVDAQRPRRLVDGTTEHAWFNNGTATIAVASEQDGVPGSRLVLSVAEITRSQAYLDHRYFDPAALGDTRERRYESPLVAPGGTVVSFFVIDDRRGEITLWIDDDQGPATVAGTWPFPADERVEPPIVAAWVSADTLLFALPDDWRDGYPRSSLFSRLVIAAGGATSVDALVGLDTVGGAAGVEMVEFDVSPDGSDIAYRLRHTDPGGDAEDTIHVASTSDLNRAIEIDRGGRGDGLHWTADGERVIAGIRGRIAQYSADGRSREYLSPRGVSANDAILVDGQLWFNGVDDRGERIWTIEME